MTDNSKNRTFIFNGKEFVGETPTIQEIDELKKHGFTNEEPCGRQICFDGWIWVLIDSPNGVGCQWYKTNARCNE